MLWGRGPLARSSRTPSPRGGFCCWSRLLSATTANRDPPFTSRPEARPWAAHSGHLPRPAREKRCALRCPPAAPHTPSRSSPRPCRPSPEGSAELRPAPQLLPGAAGPALSSPAASVLRPAGPRAGAALPCPARPSEGPSPRPRGELEREGKIWCLEGVGQPGLLFTLIK